MMFRKQTIVVAGLTVVLAGGAAFAALQGPGLLAHQGHERLLGMAKILLGLSDAQETQIRAIVGQRKAAALPLLEQLRQSHDAFQQAIESGKTDAVTLQPLADQVGRTVAQLAVMRAQAAAEIHAVLTPEQRAKARQLHDQFRDRLRQHWMQ
jgi:Spy/CpxP family protein refolding chaperone